MPKHASRVVFLGLDGGTMAVLGPLFDRGLMPRLADFWRRSASGVLRSSDPMGHPASPGSSRFPTAARRFDLHGIHEFSYLEPSDRSVRPNHAGRVRVPTLWHAIDAAGGETVSLNLPMTFPQPRWCGGLDCGSGADAPSLDLRLRAVPGLRPRGPIGPARFHDQDSLEAKAEELRRARVDFHNPETAQFFRAQVEGKRRARMPEVDFDRAHGPLPQPRSLQRSTLALPGRPSQAVIRTSSWNAWCRGLPWPRPATTVELPRPGRAA